MKKTFNVSKSKLLIALLGVLVLVAAVQTYQLNMLSEAVATGAIGTVKSSALSSLPTQVGGC